PSPGGPEAGRSRAPGSRSPSLPGGGSSVTPRRRGRAYYHFDVTDGGSVLQFPDGPKTALDELIDQLVEGADRVRRAQGRLRGLLRASASVSEDLGVDAVLRNLAEAAAGLTDPDA